MTPDDEGLQSRSETVRGKGEVIRTEPESHPELGGEGGGGEGAYVTNLRRRQVDTYAVTEDELTSIDNQYWQASVLFSLATLALGGMLSTVLASDDGGRWTLFGVLLVAAIAFGGMGAWIHRSRKTLLNRIKKQTFTSSTSEGAV